MTRKPKICSTPCILPISSFYIQVFSQLGSLLKNCDISLHLVEVSQKLSEIQALTLTEEKVPLERNAESPVYMKGVTKSGIPVSWYRDLQDVPKGNYFTLINERILIIVICEHNLVLQYSRLSQCCQFPYLQRLTDIFFWRRALCQKIKSPNIEEQ